MQGSFPLRASAIISIPYMPGAILSFSLMEAVFRCRKMEFTFRWMTSVLQLKIPAIISMHLRRSVSEGMTDMRVESRCIASSSLFGSVPGFLPRKEMAKY